MARRYSNRRRGRALRVVEPTYAKAQIDDSDVIRVPFGVGEVVTASSLAAKLGSIAPLNPSNRNLGSYKFKVASVVFWHGASDGTNANILVGRSAQKYVNTDEEKPAKIRINEGDPAAQWFQVTTTVNTSGAAPYVNQSVIPMYDTQGATSALIQDITILTASDNCEGYLIVKVNQL